MKFPTCPRCGATITTQGVSHCGPGGQWECRCGHIGPYRDPADAPLIGRTQRESDESMFRRGDARAPFRVPLA